MAVYATLFLCNKFEIELNRLVTQDSLEPVEVAEWATPIVAVLKRSKTKVHTVEALYKF